MSKGMGLGGCIVSRNIFEKKGNLKWCIKERPVNEIDNGWRFLSDIDTDEFLADSSNMLVCNWETVFELEPAILEIYDMPVGTEVTLVIDHGKRYFIYTETGELVEF